MMYIVTNIKKENDKILGDISFFSTIERFDERQFLDTLEIKFNHENSNWNFKMDDNDIQLFQKESECFFHCADCGEIHNINSGKRVERKHYCNNCITVCDICGYTAIKKDLKEINGEVMCSLCFDVKYTKCSDCGKIVKKQISKYDDITKEYYCDDCAETNLVKCNNCGYFYKKSNISSNTDTIDEFGHVCVNCEEYLINNTIRGYHDTPMLTFHGEGKKFFGIELEVSGGGKENSKARKLKRVLKNNHFYFSRDSSINNGFEIISHPHSFEEINNIDWESAEEMLVDLGYENNEPSCGTHVHISKKSFGKNDLERDYNYSKMLYFFEKYWSKILKFSRRTESEIVRWANRYGMDTPEIILEKAKCSDKYRCLNLINRETVEFRVFKGTTDASEIRAIIEFCHLLSENVKTIPVEKLAITKFSSFLKGMSNNLKTKLIERGCIPKPVDKQEISFDEMILMKETDFIFKSNEILAKFEVYEESILIDDFIKLFGVDKFLELKFKGRNIENLDKIKTLRRLTIRDDIKKVNELYDKCSTNIGTTSIMNNMSGLIVDVNINFKKDCFYKDKNIICFKVDGCPYVFTELMFEELYKTI